MTFTASPERPRPALPPIKNIGLGARLKEGQREPSDGQKEGEPRCCQHSAPFTFA